MKYWDTISFKEKIERWQNAIRVLDAMPQHEREHHWDMSTFGMPTACGTVACAAGHCAMDRWFRLRGLTVRMRKRAIYDPNDDNTYHHAIAYVGKEFPAKVINFFGMDGANAIFFSPRQRSVEHVIDEIHNHISVLKIQEERENDSSKT